LRRSRKGNSLKSSQDSLSTSGETNQMKISKPRKKRRMSWRKGHRLSRPGEHLNMPPLPQLPPHLNNGPDVGEEGSLILSLEDSQLSDEDGFSLI
jgi:hypothetical protein